MLILLALPFFFSPVSSRLLNVTIDDTLGDELTKQKPLYEPDDWTARSVSGAPCIHCTAQPDPTFCYEGTWHDKSTFPDKPPGIISLNFTGTRIYVFFILFNDIGTPNHNTRLRFDVDDTPGPAREFLHLGDSAGEKYLYDQLVFDSQDMDLGNHTLRIYSYSNGRDGSVALFDYAVYTTSLDRGALHNTTVHPVPTSLHPAPTSSRHGERSSHRGSASVIPITSGLLVALLLAAGGWIYVWRRRRGSQIPYPQTERIADVVTRHAISEREDKLLRAFPSVFFSFGHESAQLRNELGRVRDELERVRRIAEPPDYVSAV